ncbi:zinc finger protein Xfin-like isoform X2 [Hippocampus comes]|uniref:zinc finger protein Xfin-like isoform X2 n=1 Tax=Hippocampus comes TaxID=109280 RepID=UPI00094EC8E0|nr:PREDICTED: zinc finger protein Xfin-like isoform X2 [Hippocampus comes]
MCKVTMLRELVKLKLHVAVEEIFELFEKTIAEYEEEFRRSEEARKRRRCEEPDAVLKPRARLRKGTVVPTSSGVCPVSEDSEEEEEVPSEERGEPPAKKTMTEEKMTLRTSQRKTTQANGERCEDPHSPPDYLAPISDTEGMASDSDNIDDVRRAKQTKKKSKCRECGKMFARREDLDRHAKTHTGKKPLNSAAVTQPSEAVRSFTCSVCKKCFRSQDNLNSHLRTHTKEKAVPSGSSSQQVTPRAGGQRGNDLHPQQDHLAPVSNTDNVTPASDRERDAKGPSERKKLKCSRCGKTFSRKRDLKRHARTHTGNQPLNGAKPADGAKSFTCSVCTKSFTSRDLLISHIRQAHTEEKTVASASSGEHVVTEGKSNHLQSQPDKLSPVTKPSDGVESFPRSVCTKSFTSGDLLIPHMRAHEEEKPVASAGSGQRVVSKSKKLRSLPDKSAPVAKPSGADEYFACSFCPKTFMTRDFLMSHERTHNEEKPAASTSSGQLAVTERQKLHSQPDKLMPVAKPSDAVRSLSCSICMKNFSSRDLLMSHVQAQHNKEEPVTSSISPQHGTTENKNLHSQPDKLATVTKLSEVEKYFTCSFCPKIFTTRDFLKSHERTHTEEKAVASTSSSQRRVSESKKLHSLPNKSAPVPKPSEADKYFNCSVCSKSFTTQDFLTSHLQTHKEEKTGSRRSLASGGKKPRSQPDKLPPAADKDDVTSDSSDSDNGGKGSLDTNKKCSENGEMFVRKAYLDDHTKTQTGKKALNRAGVTKLLLSVKSLNCSVCPKTFVSKELLVAHMRVHKGPTSARPSGYVTTEEKGDHGEGVQSRPEGLLAPLSDSDLTSDSSEDDPRDNGVSVMTTRNS